jgi:hypothetical protein
MIASVVECKASVSLSLLSSLSISLSLDSLKIPFIAPLSLYSLSTYHIILDSTQEERGERREEREGVSLTLQAQAILVPFGPFLLYISTDLSRYNLHTIFLVQGLQFTHNLSSSGFTIYTQSF